MSIDPVYLAQAALAVHAILVHHGLNHVFLGGFEMLLLGCADRTTKDIDVEVDKPFFGGFEKVRDAFKEHPQFMVFDGTRTDGIRAIWARTVGIDILMRPGRLPKTSQPFTLPVGPPVPHTNLPITLPFFHPTSLLIEKVKCAGERRKAVDVVDVRWLYEILAVQAGIIDLRKVRKNLGSEDLRRAVTNHPELAPALRAISV